MRTIPHPFHAVADLREDPDRRWTSVMCRDLCDIAASPWGQFFAMLDEPIRVAIIEGGALRAVCMSDNETTKAQLNCLRRDMLKTAGLEDRPYA